MDLDIILEGLDSMETGMCHLCLQDIPIDVDSPNGLLRNVLCLESVCKGPSLSWNTE